MSTPSTDVLNEKINNINLNISSIESRLSLLQEKAENGTIKINQKLDNNHLEFKLMITSFVPRLDELEIKMKKVEAFNEKVELIENQIKGGLSMIKGISVFCGITALEIAYRIFQSLPK